jgi:hypothetical protein
MERRQKSHYNGRRYSRQAYARDCDPYLKMIITLIALILLTIYRFHGSGMQTVLHIL